MTFQLTRCPFCSSDKDPDSYRDFGKDFFANTYRCGRCERRGRLSELHEDIARERSEQAERERLRREHAEKLERQKLARRQARESAAMRRAAKQIARNYPRPF